MSKILKAGETGFGILVENDAGYINGDLNPSLINENFEIKPNEPVLINCILQKWGVKNKNGRIYPKEILLPQVNLYQESVNNNSGIGECFTPDTKIMTKDGWKLIKNISNDEEVLTLNRTTGIAEYQKITKKIYEDYSGDIYHIKSRNNLDIKVTPNHRFLIKDRVDNFIEVRAESLFEDIDNNKYYNGDYKIPKKIKHIHLNKRFIKVNKTHYEGKIVCVKVPNETIFVMRNGKALWTLNSDHPDSSIISLQNISHMITKMWWGKGKEENVLYGELKIIVSPGYIKLGIVSVVGDKILLYLQNKIKLGISSRGVGSLKEINGENYVQADFELIGFDLVSTPSTPGAFLFPKNSETSMGFGENYQKNNTGIYLKEENSKAINAINRFLL
jgi:hypothetical protein